MLKDDFFYAAVVFVAAWSTLCFPSPVSCSSRRSSLGKQLSSEVDGVGDVAAPSSSVAGFSPTLRDAGVLIYLMC